MMIQLLQNDPGRYFAIVIVVVVSIVLHELAHGVTAVWFGDRTPIETGHMTLNPLVHMGGISLILLFVAGFAWGLMPVNPSRMRGKYADFWVSAAGPATNFVLAVIGMVIFGLLIRFADHSSDVGSVGANARLLLWELATTNIALMLLNLLPVPPLDGSRMLANVSPAYRRLLSGEMAGGFATAALFAIFLGGGSMLWSAANWVTVRGVLLVAGLPGPEAG